jgi:hypothetical protein
MAIRFPIFVMPLINITVGQRLHPLPTLKKVLKLPLISLPSGGDMNTMSLHPPSHPVPDVAVSLGGFPDTGTMPEPIEPLPLISLAILPVELPLTATFIILELAKVNAKWCDFTSRAFDIVFPGSLKFIVLGNINSSF